MRAQQHTEAWKSPHFSLSAKDLYAATSAVSAAEGTNVVVLEDGRELKILAKNDMGESIIGTPAIADGRLYLRTRTKLYCLAQKT